MVKSCWNAGVGFPETPESWQLDIKLDFLRIILSTSEAADLAR